MGARPDQQLALSFLEALQARWAALPPGTYKVGTESEDLVPALAQICIRAFAADVRDLGYQSEYRNHPGGEPGSVIAKQLGQKVEGSLDFDDSESNGDQTPTVRQVCDKIVHGDPRSIVVTLERRVALVYVNMKPSPRTGNQAWDEIFFYSDSFLERLHGILHLTGHRRKERDRSVLDLLDLLGPEKLLPRQDLNPRVD